MRLEVATTIGHCVQAVLQTRGDLLKQIHTAQEASEQAAEACKAYKLKLGAAKSVVSLTKGSLDETTAKIGALRGQLAQAQGETQDLERHNKELAEDLATAHARLATEMRMKVSWNG